MALKPAKQAEWEKTLKELELISEDDCIVEHVQGDRWTFSSQTRGNFFFTKEKFVFVGGFGLKSFAVKYSDIKEIKKCMISMFIPTGIRVTAFNPESGKEERYKCSVMKRKNWMAYLSEKSGVACS